MEDYSRQQQCGQLEAGCLAVYTILTPYAFGLLVFLLELPFVAISHPMAVVGITGIFVGAALVVGFSIGIVATKIVSQSSISVKVLSVAMAMVFDLAVFGWVLVKAYS